MMFISIRKNRKERRTRLRIAVILYGQPRFHRAELGILRTLRILRRHCSEVQISGHLWADGHTSELPPSSPINFKNFPGQIEVSNPNLIDISPQAGRDENLVRQATSQRRALQSAAKTILDEPDLVLISRTDLWIPNPRVLIRATPEDGEVWASNFHHSRVDDNIALLSWKSFQNLKDVDFIDALGSQGVIHGEHLRAQILYRSELRLAERFLPYIILRKDRSPYVGFAFAFVRMVLRSALPLDIYEFLTSPKSELARLFGVAVRKN